MRLPQCLQVRDEIIELVITNLGLWKCWHRSQAASGLQANHETRQGLVVQGGGERRLAACVTLMAMLKEHVFAASDVWRASKRALREWFSSTR
jgi:hypothetical protein